MRAILKLKRPALIKYYFVGCYVVLIEEFARALRS
jgi:hypothetical protein